MDVQKHTTCYSCHDTKHTFGTGFILNKKIKQFLMDFQAVSPKLGYLCLREKFNDYSIISLYRQKKKEDEEKDRFYEELDHLWGRCVQDMMYKL
ncbi:hypothetical protein CDAR_417471 [Caerostris darwini]|uniref:Uncharacterized protein n=1 Tax=Caerostris darwini TaxID=1538125 RepID=A0AAV4VS45_9ARAC|nr:hypothetical protein CDAR_417471 [Caerostris darwini]